MTYVDHREANLKPSKRNRFLHNVGARLAALALWKVIVLVVVLVLGTGLAATAAFKILPHHTAKQPASEGVVLGKLVSLGNFEAAKRVYDFNFPFVVHKSFLFFTGETIQVTGSGSDDALVDFTTLTKGGLVRTGPSSLTLLIPTPTLGPAVVNLSQTRLKEKSGLLTHLSHAFENDPQDQTKAIAAAQHNIASAASGDTQLIRTAEASTRTFLTKLLDELGYSHIRVVFG